MYEVLLSRQAKKFIKRELPQKYYSLVIDHLLALKDDPHPLGSIKLKDSTDLYRLRVGVYRIIYSIQDDELIIHVIAIGHRKDVYRP